MNVRECTLATFTGSICCMSVWSVVRSARGYNDGNKPRRWRLRSHMEESCEVPVLSKREYAPLEERGLVTIVQGSQQKKG